MSEYLRQFMHIFSGSIIILALIFLGRYYALIFTFIGLTVAVILTIALRNKIHLPLLQPIINNSVRKNEDKFAARGAIGFCLGVAIVLIFFDKLLVELGALCVLAFGDGFSTIFGTAFGKIKLTRHQTLEGTIGGILVSFIVLASFLDWFLAFATSTIAMLFELIDIEDNIAIPLVAAIILSLVL